MKRRSVPFQVKRSPRLKPKPAPPVTETAPTTDASAGLNTHESEASITTATIQAPENHADEEAQTEKSLWKLCLAFRLINSLLVQAYFHPDEHWMVLYGHLTWEWQRRLRSYVHPLVLPALYKMLAVLHLDNLWFRVLFIFFLCGVANWII